ncbi:DUF1918 domain-containing protein [Kitasatospora nipponensis]|uniref:DUF1918 domain-containing protein n=1 Tax=Kitasatospora nipponensis TaxID=258049 RepID=A0ABN1WTV8_9ACTN
MAEIGDTLHIHSRAVGIKDRVGEIVEVHGTDGGPPYLVKFEDGTQSLVFPGPDGMVEHPKDGTA